MNRQFAVRVALGGLSIAVSWALVVFAGATPASALRGAWAGAAGDAYALGETLVVAVPLALVGLGAVPSLRVGLLSVGAEGQLVTGAFTSTMAVLAAGRLPPLALLAIGATAGAVGGAAWAMIPAWLRARRGVSEVLTTLLTNYLAVALVTYLLGLLHQSGAPAPTPRSDPLPSAAMLAALWPGTRLHVGALLVFAAAGVLAMWLRTRSALVHAVQGRNPVLGARLGLSAARATYQTLGIAGAAAGIAGWLQVAGLQGTLYPSIGSGLGFLGLLTALVGGQRPAGILLASLLFGALLNGADGMQTDSGVPATLATLFQGLALLAVGLAIGARATASDRS